MRAPDGPLGLVSGLLNRSIRQSETAQGELAALAGTTLRIDVEGLGLTLFLVAGEEEIGVCRQATASHATVAGTPVALLGMLAESAPDAATLRRRGVRLDGDQNVAAAFAGLLRRARPDLEEELSFLVGDVAAHQAGTALRALLTFGERTLDTLRLNTSEYLQEESRVMPTRLEVKGFCDDVDEIRDAVARAAARLTRLEQRRGLEED
jgi:ubiquinone biosynthesis protein UbiJ